MRIPVIPNQPDISQSLKKPISSILNILPNLGCIVTIFNITYPNPVYPQIETSFAGLFLTCIVAFMDVHIHAATYIRSVPTDTLLLSKTDSLNRTYNSCTSRPRLESLQKVQLQPPAPSGTWTHEPVSYDVILLISQLRSTRKKQKNFNLHESLDWWTRPDLNGWPCGYPCYWNHTRYHCATHPGMDSQVSGDTCGWWCHG